MKHIFLHLRRRARSQQAQRIPLHARARRQETGVELTEAEGIEDSPEYRESIGQTWLPGYLILSSIGEGGTRFTPIQLANYVATIANGGTRYEQHLIKSVKSADYSETLREKQI